MLPHLFSQHSSEVERGRDCRHFTEEEVQAHRGQLACPRSQAVVKLEWGPRAGPGFSNDRVLYLSYNEDRNRQVSEEFQPAILVILSRLDPMTY